MALAPNRHVPTYLFRIVVALLTCLTIAPFAYTVHAQTAATRSYYVYRSVTATSNVITIQQPAAAGRSVKLLGGWVYCSVGCTLTISKNGTLSSGSVGTVNTLDTRAPAAKFTATYDGTIGGSPVTVIAIPIPAGGNWPIEGGLFLPYTTGVQDQFSFSVSGSSGTQAVYINAQEF